MKKEAAAKRNLAKKLAREQAKKEGRYLTKAQKEKKARSLASISKFGFDLAAVKAAAKEKPKPRQKLTKKKAAAEVVEKEKEEEKLDSDASDDWDSDSDDGLDDVLDDED